MKKNYLRGKSVDVLIYIKVTLTTTLFPHAGYCHLSSSSSLFLASFLFALLTCVQMMVAMITLSSSPVSLPCCKQVILRYFFLLRVIMFRNNRSSNNKKEESNYRASETKNDLMSFLETPLLSFWLGPFYDSEAQRRREVKRTEQSGIKPSMEGAEEGKCTAS